jgi:diaminopimelate decarboxylase/aspartate kinase
LIPAERPPSPWWRIRRDTLLATLDDRDCAYVYDLGVVARQAEALLAMQSVARVFYALKANSHPEVLRTIAALGLGFECVSRPEVERVLDSVPGIAVERLLFTPNFAPSSEYRWALERGLRVTVDNLYVLRTWGSLFAGRDILLRLDTGHAHGHHDKVRTAGSYSKFGVPPAEFPELKDAAAKAGATVVALHAHGGSGSFDIDGWLQSARVLAALAAEFPRTKAFNLGGGLGVPERAGQAPMDLGAFDASLDEFRRGHPAFDLWLEPGRFLVAAAGVLLARVTQTKGKGPIRYVGVATGMNSLIRPALYGAWHEIVNLTRLEEPPTDRCTVVGPICESGDVLGSDRQLPPCREGDVILIGNAGAYGHAMGSHYNLRPPAAELLMPV